MNISKTAGKRFEINMAASRPLPVEVDLDKNIAEKINTNTLNTCIKASFE